MNGAEPRMNTVSLHEVHIIHSLLHLIRLPEEAVMVGEGAGSQNWPIKGKTKVRERQEAAMEPATLA